jgi:RNA polymerase sigma-70 factor (ECF subfamily)
MDIKTLFLAHRRELQAYLTQKLRDGEAAAELTQEAFLRFAEQGPGGPAAVAHPRSYLYRTAHNLAVDHIRRQQRERTDPVAPDDMAGIADDRPSPERTAGARSDVASARLALLELPERTRQVFALARMEGLTYGEVARRLQISDSSVQKHLAKALKHVMQRLRPT